MLLGKLISCLISQGIKIMLETGALDEVLLAKAIDEKRNAAIQMIFFMGEAVEEIRCAVSTSWITRYLSVALLLGMERAYRLKNNRRRCFSHHCFMDR